MEHYYKTKGKSPDELIVLKIEGLKNINSEKEWQAEDLLDNYLYSSDTKLTIHQKSLALSAVKSFLRDALIGTHEYAIEVGRILA